MRASSSVSTPGQFAWLPSQSTASEALKKCTAALKKCSSTEKVQQHKDNPRQSAFLGKRRTPAPKPGKQHKANPQPSPAEAPLIVTGTERTETRASFRGSVDWSRKPGLQERFVRTDDHIYSVHMAWYMGGDLVALPLTAQARGELCRGQLWIEANPCFRVICHRYIYIYR